MHVHSTETCAVATSSKTDLEKPGRTIPFQRFMEQRGRRISIKGPPRPRPEPLSHRPCGLPLAKEIAKICELTGTSKTRFGRDAAGDPRLYHDLKFCGRRPGRELRLRILAHINHLAIEHARHCTAGATVTQTGGGR